jgi:hypothetical protein
MREQADPDSRPAGSEPPEGNDLDCVERRGAPRYPCDLEPFWMHWGSTGAESAAARVSNISATGVCLETPGRIRLGSVLVLQLLRPAQGMSRPLVVRIIHSTAQPTGRWLSGGAFVRRLSDRDLQALLQKSLGE